MDTQSKAWDQVASAVDFTLEPDLAVFQKFVTKAARILDYGCGYGRVGLALHGQGYANVTGYDTSPEMVARGRRQAPFLPLHAYSYPDLPESDASFDAVICCAVLTCLPEETLRQGSVGEITRVLKPGGIFYMAEFLRHASQAYDQDGKFVSSKGVAMKHFYQSELEALVQGFERKHLTVTPAHSLSGELMEAFHFFGMKPPAQG